MDEMRLLETLLAEPDPSQETIDRSMRTLRASMDAPASRTGRRAGLRRRPALRRPVLTLATFGVAAAAAAAAVIVVADSGSPAGTPPSATALDGRAVLLAAADTAETKPQGSGTYWQVTETSSDGTSTTTWMGRDGQAWISRKPGLISKVPIEATAASRFGLTFDKVAKLPTDPERLKAALDALRPPTAEEDALPPPTADEKTGVMVGKLLSLINTWPSAPKVRAAAFRALATLPHIKDLGEGEGGHRLEFSYGGGGTRLIVDPATTRVSAEGFTEFDGESMGVTTSKGEWTDALPKARTVSLDEQHTATGH
ncbi:CU044_5270 family protein [Actinomadura algeriensis]|uniref:CU044_5270 family protein n=1 Tax=Actinomadura algeriensis TaxID=1679523 RepID=A0ABR9JMI7_9ACTN|nr:CU044_5270 family protein [Actinomadura algeriensis]MBE1531633.1 hypothetical protein [Actinomadura algeriensis]